MRRRGAPQRHSFGLLIAACAGLLPALSQSVLSAATDRSLGLISRYGAGPGIMNHPVGVVPSSAIAVPADWPLDAKGAISCLTCHTEIRTDRTHEKPKLRDCGPQTIEPPQFCAKCHGGITDGTAGAAHRLALGAAHLLPGPSESPMGGGQLDEQTRRCLSCHDGVSAPESANNTPWNGSRGYYSDTRSNHPIGVRYDDPSRPKNLSRLRPAGLLPREVALPDGKVGCVSCHNLYAGQPHLLTVPVRGSELCLTCHDMR